MPSTCAVILAAGKSTRMKSALPKGLHPLWGKPVLGYVIDAGRAAGAEPVTLVVGHGASQIRAAFGGTVRYADQPQQLGTGHALLCAEPEVPADCHVALVLPGDTPLITEHALERLLAGHASRQNDATVLTTVLSDATHYGRIVRGPDGAVQRIVEARDASAAEQEIREINTAIYAFRRTAVFDALRRLRPDNAQGEYYLTDIVALLAAGGGRVGAVVCEDPALVLGINHRAELADAARILQDRRLRELMLAGVTIVDPRNTYVDCHAQIGKDTTLEPGCLLQGSTTVGCGCVIGPHTQLIDTSVADGARVFQSRLEGCRVGREARVGPFAAMTQATVEAGAITRPLEVANGGRIEAGRRTEPGGPTWVA